MPPGPQPTGANPAGINPEMFEKMRTFIHMIAPDLYSAFCQNGGAQHFAEYLGKVVSQHTPHPQQPMPVVRTVNPGSVSVVVDREDENGNLVKVQTTTAQLLAEIADTQLHLLDRMEIIVDEIDKPKRQRKRRKRSAE